MGSSSFRVAVGSALALFAGGYAGCSSTTIIVQSNDITPSDAAADGTSSADASGGSVGGDAGATGDATLSGGDDAGGDDAAGGDAGAGDDAAGGDAAGDGAAGGDAAGDGAITDADVADVGDSAITDASDGAAPTVSVTMTMDPFTVNAGAEAYKCQQFANPFGHDVDLVRLDGTKTTDVTQFWVFNMAPTTGRTTTTPIMDCPANGIEFHPFAYTSQWGATHYVETYPDANMGYPFVRNNGFMLSAHALNLGTRPVSPSVTITVTPAAAGTVSVRVGHVFLNNTFFSVPNGIDAGSPRWFSKTMTPITSEAFTIFRSWDRMHYTGTDFQVSMGGSATGTPRGLLNFA